MSAEKLTITMEKLLKLHKSLYELAQKKTDIVKKADMDALNQMIKDEQAHIAAINILESDRQKVAAALVSGTEKPTMEDCLHAVDDGQREALDRLRTDLVGVISQIRQRNDLNQEMIYQSLQFVNLSLNLVAPQPEDFNYGPQAGQPKGPGLLNVKA
ncbi:flagellar protein FlgN [Bacillus sp. EB600]|uniref:flagellar protein FlgN n=1 Tax=Bacillus sp. EB600 TaxID=2806345 RepID=UPI00210B3FC6|nr:flagellar protein FlgN [Bacillus sp. EB600]MCQ6278691.1 flagellar protein FlgN [Bacillus sp. EB600]